MAGPAVTTNTASAVRFPRIVETTPPGPGRLEHPGVNTADDIVDVLLVQHHTLRELSGRLAAAAVADRKRLLAELAVLVYLHTRGEQTVVHPVTRDHTGYGGYTVGTACLAQEERIGRALAELSDLDADPIFPASFAAFRRTFLDHLADEECDEFPRLRRRIPTQQLHSMANDIRNVQAMR